MRGVGACACVGVGRVGVACVGACEWPVCGRMGERSCVGCGRDRRMWACTVGCLACVLRCTVRVFYGEKGGTVHFNESLYALRGKGFKVSRLDKNAIMGIKISPHKRAR